MEVVEATPLRNNWRSYVENVRLGEQFYVIATSGDLWGVLMSKPNWDAGAAVEPVEPELQVTLGASDVKFKLRDRRLDIKAGKHILIVEHAGQSSNPRPKMVLAPLEWTKRAIPDAGEIVMPADKGR